MIARHHMEVAAATCVPLSAMATSHGTNPVITLAGCVMFVAASVLPDADSPNTLASKWLRLPGEHRTWTHAIWVPALLLWAGTVLWPLTWFGGGWLCHVLCDSLSRAGVCWLWPLQRYVRYPNGAFVADGHRYKFYKTGRDSVSERVVTTTLVVALVTLGVVLWIRTAKT